MLDGMLPDSGWGRINSGGSPCILEPTPEYIGAVGRNRILFLYGNSLTLSPVTSKFNQKGSQGYSDQEWSCWEPWHQADHRCRQG